MTDDNILSQDEIDALLQGDLGLDDLDEEDDQGNGAAGGGGSDGGSSGFTAEQIRVLHEIVDACLISEIGVLTEYVQQEVALANSKTPEIVTEADLKNELLSTQSLFLNYDFEQGKSGVVLESLPSAMITCLMTGEEWDGDPDYEWDELKLSALQDCFNGFLGKFSAALKTATGADFVSQSPKAQVLSGSDFPPDITMFRQPRVVKFSYDFVLGEELPTQFRYLLSEELAKNLILSKLPDAVFAEVPQSNASAEVPTVNNDLESSNVAPQVADSTVSQSMPAASNHGGIPMQADPNGGQGQMMPPPQAMMQAQMASGQIPQAGADGQQMPYAPWQFAPITPHAMGQDQLSNMELLRDVTLQITVELGRARMPIGEILELVNGSIVELNKQAGEAVELYVQGKLIARGEVVIIDENFGIRITSIVSPTERLSTTRSK